MPLYGKTTVGTPTWASIEVTMHGREITVPATETGVAIQAYLRTEGAGVSGNAKVALYRTSDEGLAYESSEVNIAEDATGGWKVFSFAQSIAAGTYMLAVVCGGIAGGANTISIAYESVTSTTTLKRKLGAGYPTLSSPAAWDVTSDTRDTSLYLETESGDLLSAQVCY